MENIKVYDVRFLKGDSAFLIDDGKTSILYDTGFGFTGYKVAENIKKILGDRKLDYIFLTHSHYDHALGSAYILRYYPEACVVAGKYAADVFKRDGAKRKMKELDNSFAKDCGFPEYEFLGDELRVDIAVSDGDIVKAGDLEFEILELPGHTNCSVGYYCKEKKLFLSSETLGVYVGDNRILPVFLVSCSRGIESIDKVLGYDIEYVLAPHYGILTPEETKFFLNNVKPSATYFVEKYREFIREGKSNEEIVEIFKELLWKGYVKEIYPEEALKLNTSIMAELVRKEYA
ncbi:MAG: MBL fold metallo-hydrolase [Lachnospiraceae bacterium]|nr:MBL fold metallo-hydrolase [Lachnospiraceae bacterium]